jgi:septal ring-binding cell division protein DamX
MLFCMAENKRRDNMRNKGKSKKKKAARKNKVTAVAKKSTRRNLSGKKVRPAAKKKRASKPASKETRSPEPSTLRGSTFPTARPRRSRIASRSAGQAGDLQGLSRKAVVDSESVEELVEEGQAREAAAISGVENAPDPDEAEVHTRQVPEDDVPEEYTDND